VPTSRVPSGIPDKQAERLPGVADVYADDFRKASERNAAVLARAAERGFGT